MVQIGMARETQRGTAVAAPSFMIPFTEHDLNEKQDRAIDEQSYGVIEGMAGESIIKQWMEGGIKAPIGQKHFPLLLYSILGTINTVTGTATGTPYYHTITVLQNAQHPTLTFHIDDPLSAQDYTHPLCAVTDIEINYERGNFLNYTVNIRGKTGSASAITPAGTTEGRFLPSHLTFRVGTAQANLATGTAISLKSAVLRITANVEDDDVLGNLNPVDFLGKQFTIEGEVEALFQNESDFKTNSLTGTARALRFDLVDSGTTIGTGSTNPGLRIDLHSVQFQPISKPIKVNDLVMQRVAFRAHYKSAESAMVTILATNGVVSY